METCSLGLAEFTLLCCMSCFVCTSYSIEVWRYMQHFFLFEIVNENYVLIVRFILRSNMLEFLLCGTRETLPFCLKMIGNLYIFYV